MLRIKNMEDKQYRYAEVSGYNFVHRTVSYDGGELGCNQKRSGQSISASSAASGSLCVRWVKRKLTIVTFVLLLISVVLFGIVSIEYSHSRLIGCGFQFAVA